MRTRRLLQITILALSLTILFLSLRELYKDKNRRISTSRFESLTVKVNGPGDGMNINCFYDLYHGSGAWYFFLPSCADPALSTVDFRNASYLEIEDINGTILKIPKGGNLGGLNRNETYLIRFCRSDGSVAEEGKIEYMHSEELPAVFITTESGRMDLLEEDKSHSESGQIYIVNPDGTADVLSALSSIHGHGNTSWRLDKRPWLLELQRNFSVLGMNPAKKWLLIANRLDVSKVRNPLVNEMSDVLNIPYMNYVYADVYFNGQYGGLFQIYEKPEVWPGRIDITDLDNENKKVNSTLYKDVETDKVNDDNSDAERVFAKLPHDPGDITGGYLIEHNYADRYGYRACRFRTKTGERYTLRSPTYATKAEVDYIADLFQKVEDLAIAGDPSIEQYIDLESFADKYLLEEFINNEANAATSSFFYKDVDFKDPLLHAGPAWDYDKILGNTWNDSMDYIETLKFNTNHKHQTMLFYNLYQKNEAFLDIVKRNYRDKLRPYVEKLIESDLDRLSQDVEHDRGMDALRWHDTPESIAEDKEFIRTYLKKRMDFCDRVWLEDAPLCIVHFQGDLQDRNPYIGVIKGDPMGDLPFLPDAAEGQEVCWVNQATGEQITEGTIITENIEAVVEKKK
ncbi:MAG: CotH kinase family protein [Lachnospiraceae bacterium]|nr:CotH kinase family protein [Lachnospiraceae bacterium]